MPRHSAFLLALALAVVTAAHAAPPLSGRPFIYVIDYSDRWVTDPAATERLGPEPPDILHIGKAVPITHSWGPIPYMAGENQDTGGKGHTLNLESIRLLSPEELTAKIEQIEAAVQRLHDAGLTDVKVLVSGDIDEYRIETILGAGAPVDGFGVGGNLGVGLGTIDSGTVGGVIGAVYKLVWFDSDPDQPGRIKLAGGKSTWPGRKQVYRMNGFERDIIQLDGEPAPEGGRALLEPIVVDGKRVMPEESVHDIRKRAMASLDALPATLRELTPETPYRVDMSDGLLALRKETIAHYEAQVEQQS